MTAARIEPDRVELTSLLAYLRQQGWHQRERWRHSTIWAYPETDPATEVLVPDRDVADFGTRVADLVDQVARVEVRSAESLMHDVRVILHDVVRLAVESRGDFEAVPLSVGVGLVEGAQSLLLAAASAAADPRANYPTRKPQRAVEYMSRVKLGQTETGSYVVTLLSPVSPALETGLFPDLLPDPFERRVTTLLADAVDTARTVADQAIAAGSLEEFSNVVEAGVSANLCDALADVIPETGGADSVRIGIRWSPQGPAPRARVSEINLSSDLQPIMREAARFFREAIPQSDYELLGYVVRLHREPDPATPGEVVVTNEGAAAPQVVSVQLGPQEYQEAVVAHGEIRLVSMVGRLVRAGPRTTLEDVRDFRVIPDLPV